MSRTPRRPVPPVPQTAPSSSTATPAPSPGAAAETAPEAAATAFDGSTSAAPPESPAPAGAALQPLGLEHDDASAARTLDPTPDAALAQAQLQPGDPAAGLPGVDLPSADPSRAPVAEISEPGVDAASAELQTGMFSEQDWRERQLRRMTRPGLPVMFREHERRFNGLPATPAIITRVYDDLVVNLMVLPDGAEPYPRMSVPFEAELDPEGLGRAWTHIHFDDG